MRRGQQADMQSTCISKCQLFSFESQKKLVMCERRCKLENANQSRRREAAFSSKQDERRPKCARARVFLRSLALTLGGRSEISHLRAVCSAADQTSSDGAIYFLLFVAPLVVFFLAFRRWSFFFGC